MEQEEIWKPIKNFEGYYEVSSWGRVRSVDRYVKHNCGGLKLCKGKIMKPKTTHNGYLRVILYVKHKSKCFFVHRLVAQAFIHNDDPEHKTQCDHINECKHDNRQSNLRWVTAKQNINHGSCIQRGVEKRKNDPKRSKRVYQYTLDGKFVKEWSSLREIQRQLGFKHNNISKCCRGKAQTAYGYIWRFASDVDKEKGVA